MHPLHEEFKNSQIYLQQMLECEVSLMQEFLTSSNPQIVKSIGWIRQNRILQTQFLKILASRIYKKNSDENILDQIDLKAYPNLIDIYMLKDELLSLVDKINHQSKPCNDQPSLKKEQKLPSKKPLTLLD